LHVTDCNISKANVCDYIGAEIPGYAALGLDPGRLYKMYREAAALAAAAPTFENKQLMFKHVEVNAANPEKLLTVGTVSNVRWVAPYLVADLAVWDAEAIKAIQNESQRDLSCGYRYTPIMKPGIIDGVSYDGSMIQIVGNHVALVELGRVGPDVMVADAALRRAPRPIRTIHDIPGYGRLRNR
jgi:hypothetical protein